MSWKRHAPGQIFGMLRESDVWLAQGQTVGEISACLNMEIFRALKEALTLIEQWRRLYNTELTHRAPNYRPLAPEAPYHWFGSMPDPNSGTESPKGPRPDAPA